MPSPSPATEAACPPQSVRRARALLGTRVEIGVCADLPVSELHAAIDAAFGEIERVQQLMSCQDAHSELSRINRSAHRKAERVDRHTFTVLARALQLAELSEGAFDPCVGALLEHWGLLPLAHTATPLGGRWDDIQLLGDQRVRYRRALRLDLGGIAKGYAVDLAVECLQQRGVQSLIVNAGGDLRVAGTSAFEIGLRDPHSPGQSAHTLWLQQAALATSAAYDSRRELPQDEEVCALLDVRSGQAFRGYGSISVRAARCIDADALTKVVLFAPPALVERVLEGCDAVVYALS